MFACIHNFTLLERGDDDHDDDSKDLFCMKVFSVVFILINLVLWYWYQILFLLFFRSSKSTEAADTFSFQG